MNRLEKRMIISRTR